MKASELRDKSEAELREQIHQNNKALYKMRADSATGTVPNPKLYGQLRREIARCLTLLTEKERAVGAGQ